jgi:Tfp pilus assembly protein PilV
MKLERRRPSGFSLVEVTLALGVAAFCLVTIFALLPTSFRTNQITIQQTADTTLARAIAADLQATPKTASDSPRYGITFPATGTASHTIFLQEDGTISGTQDTDADPSLNPRYRATITLIAPTNPLQKAATGIRIRLTWPALADKSAAATPSNYAGAYEVFTAVNRN